VSRETKLVWVEGIIDFLNDLEVSEHDPAERAFDRAKRTFDIFARELDRVDLERRLDREWDAYRASTPGTDVHRRLRDMFLMTVQEARARGWVVEETPRPGHPRPPPWSRDRGIENDRDVQIKDLQEPGYIDVVDPYGQGVAVLACVCGRSLRDSPPRRDSRSRDSDALLREPSRMEFKAPIAIELLKGVLAAVGVLLALDSDGGFQVAEDRVGGMVTIEDQRQALVQIADSLAAWRLRNRGRYPVLDRSYAFAFVRSKKDHSLQFRMTVVR
jgi:hypothetical protein